MNMFMFMNMFILRHIPRYGHVNPKRLFTRSETQPEGIKAMHDIGNISLGGVPEISDTVVPTQLSAITRTRCHG